MRKKTVVRRPKGLYADATYLGKVCRKHRWLEGLRQTKTTRCVGCARANKPLKPFLSRSLADIEEA